MIGRRANLPEQLHQCRFRRQRAQGRRFVHGIAGFQRREPGLKVLQEGIGDLIHDNEAFCRATGLPAV